MVTYDVSITKVQCQKLILLCFAKMFKEALISLFNFLVGLKYILRWMISRALWSLRFWSG